MTISIWVRRMWRRSGALGVGAIGISLVLAACGSSTTSDGGSSKTPDAVTVGVLPIVDTAAIYLGDQKGFFKDENIDLTLQVANSGAAITPAVISGQMQFGFSNIIGIMAAVSKNLSVKAIAPGLASTNVQGKDIEGLAVTKDSPITSPAQLEGKTLGTNALANICTVSVDASIRKAGGDPTKVKWIELPIANVPASLEKGTIDAACMAEPQLGAWLAAGNKSLASPYVDLAANAMISVYFTSDKLIQDNPDLVKRFTAAMSKSLEYADGHPDEVRAIVPTYTTLSADQAKTMTLPRFPSKFDSAVVKSMEQIADGAKKDKVLADDFDVDKIIKK